MKSEDEKPGAGAAEAKPDGPPKLYFAACGALCDVFWWARRKGVDAQPQSHPSDSD